MVGEPIGPGAPRFDPQDKADRERDQRVRAGRQRRQPLDAGHRQPEQCGVEYHQQGDGIGDAERLRARQHRNAVEDRKREQNPGNALAARTDERNEDEGTEPERELRQVQGGQVERHGNAGPRRADLRAVHVGPATLGTMSDVARICSYPNRTLNVTTIKVETCGERNILIRRGGAAHFRLGVWLMSHSARAGKLHGGLVDAPIVFAVAAFVYFLGWGWRWSWSSRIDNFFGRKKYSPPGRLSADTVDSRKADIHSAAGDCTKNEGESRRDSCTEWPGGLG